VIIYVKAGGGHDTGTATGVFSWRGAERKHMWSRDALLFAILLALLSVASRLPASGGSQPFLAAAAVIGGLAFAGRTLWAVAEVARPPD
jgi:hypothetical protein